MREKNRLRGVKRLGWGRERGREWVEGKEGLIFLEFIIQGKMLGSYYLSKLFKTNESIH